MSRARQVQATPPSNIIGTGPTAEEAFDAFVTLVAFCVDHRAAATVYDQRSGHLPLDAKSPDAYKRWHRAARSAGIPLRDGRHVRGQGRALDHGPRRRFSKPACATPSMTAALEAVRVGRANGLDELVARDGIAAG